VCRTRFRMRTSCGVRRRGVSTFLVLAHQVFGGVAYTIDPAHEQEVRDYLGTSSALLYCSAADAGLDYREKVNLRIDETGALVDTAAEGRLHPRDARRVQLRGRRGGRQRA
jgi:hypothetical protein